MKHTVTIEALGAQGHGVATLSGKTIYVPYTTTGDVVELTVKHTKRGAEIKLGQVLIPGEDRQTPPCPHFGQCGGCALQHLTPEAYLTFKQETLVSTLAKRGIHDVTIHPTRTTPTQSRQRLRLALRQTAGSLVMGFQSLRSHHITDIGSCIVTQKVLTDLFSPLRKALRPLIPQGLAVDLQMTSSETGVDILLEGDWRLDLNTREALAQMAEDLDLARLIVRNGNFDDPVAIRRLPVVTLGGKSVGLPVGAFLQASPASTTLLTDLVLGSLSDITGKVADLFSGLGTFSLPLTAKHTVHAVESVDAALKAQQTAGHGLPLTIETRDLFTSPLMPDELGEYAAVVLDPPRAGALAQVTQLAQSAVPRIVYVSCSPSSFARDARILMDGGYRLEELTPVDQFLWSAHLELVATFTR